MEDDAGMYGEFGQATGRVGGSGGVSGSKRKRTLEWTLSVPVAQPQAAGAGDDDVDVDVDISDQHTPKRSRQWSAVEPRSVRRKHGRYGLSSLNKKQAQQHSPLPTKSPVRPSRFQEGSMSDKPSVQPPTLFTRDAFHSSLANVDHLMSSYDDGHVSESLNADTVTNNAPQDPAKQPGLFRFGRMFPSSFNPMNMWGSFSRTWKESKEDLTVRNIEENRRRAQGQSQVQDDKEAYERRYQELKQSGQFNFTVVSNKTLLSPRTHTSAVMQPPAPTCPLASPLASPHRHAMASLHLGANDQQAHSRDLSMTSNAASPHNPHSAAPEPHRSPGKTLKQHKSFFSIRAPSFGSLRRGRSDLNLSASSVRNTSSSSSLYLSPDKSSSHLTLSRHHSKKDLNKQHKLSKRVSDLQDKLSDARRELNDAILNASPLPPLPSRFEKFTPNSKFSSISKRFSSKFGTTSTDLPSLPSGHVLSPEDFIQDTPTIRPRPHHTKSFDLDYLTDAPATVIKAGYAQTPTSLNTNNHSSIPMDPASLLSSDPMDQSQAGHDSVSLDDKLNALDAAPKTKSNKPSSATSKKRKAKPKDDALFRPDPADEVDDEEYGYLKEKPKKKRKSSGTSKKSTISRSVSQASGAEDSVADSGNVDDSASEVGHASDKPSQNIPDHTEDVPPIRSSLDSLDPIYEEDTILVASHTSKHDSAVPSIDIESIHTQIVSKPANSIPRPRSRSPSKRPSSRLRMTSPHPVNFSKPTSLAANDYVVSATPGVNSVPAMPVASSVRDEEHEHAVTQNQRPASAATQKEQWNWPEDVF